MPPAIDVEATQTTGSTVEAAAAAAAVATVNAHVAATATVNAIQKLSSISLMLEYDIDNTLNAIKENGVHLMQLPAAALDAMPVRSASPIISKIGLGEMPTLPPTPPTTPNLQNKARKRWKILAKVLRKDSVEVDSPTGSREDSEEQSASVRRFKSFDLLRQDSFEDRMTLNCLGKPENWYKYSVLLGGSGSGSSGVDDDDSSNTAEREEYSVNIHHVERHLTASDLMGFNNTGNICVWPSEEALTAYVLADLAPYRDKWILELGGGFSCLTGLMLSKYAKPYAVHLTDGNCVSVENVKKTVCLNELSCYTKCSVLKWEDETARARTEAGKFDVILSADCLFFDEARSALIDTIHYYLSPRNGVALIMAPRRGKTMTLFVDECVARGFSVEQTQRYNETIWQRHLELRANSELYDEDLHYPELLRMTKRPTSC